MSSGFDEFWDRKIRGEESYLGQVPPEFGGPVKGVTGKGYEQLEFDFGAEAQSDKQFDASIEKHKKDWYKTREDVTNTILQANGIIKTVTDSIGSSCGTTDDHEFALWGASELLQKAAEMLE